MANGWARDGAVQDQIDDTVSDAVKIARARLPAGDGGPVVAEENWVGEWDGRELRRPRSARRLAQTMRRTPSAARNTLK